MEMTREEKRKAFRQFLDYLSELENKVPSRQFRDCAPTDGELRTLRCYLLQSEGVRQAFDVYDYLEKGGGQNMLASDPEFANGAVDLKKLRRLVGKQPRLYTAQAIYMHPSSLAHRMEGRTKFRYSELDRLADHFGYGIMYFIKTKRGKNYGG